tara:strand:- start:2066 stop:2485 length:420 start_codon:yes stop_codon:yes gene_type:complete
MNYKIIAKFIKNSKFNIPNTDTFFNLPKKIKDYTIKVDIKSKQLKEKTILIYTTLNLIPKVEVKDLIECEICLSSIVELDGNVKNKKELEEIILIKVPTDIYDELREIFVSFFQKSGYREIKLGSKVDFRKLYELRKVQ